MRFDYLHDCEPDVLSRLRSFHVPEKAKDAASAFIAAIIVVLGAAGIEHIRVAQAQALADGARARLTVSRSSLKQLGLERTHVEDLVHLDMRLRRIHASGAVLAGQLVRVANRIPNHAWLTTLSRQGETVLIEGRADDLRVVGETLNEMMAQSPNRQATLVRAEEGAPHAPGAFDFAVGVTEH